MESFFKVQFHRQSRALTLKFEYGLGLIDVMINNVYKMISSADRNVTLKGITKCRQAALTEAINTRTH